MGEVKKTFRQIREERGIRTGYVAEKLGISVNSVCAKETGRRHFNVREVGMLLDLYGVEYGDIDLLV